MDVKMDIKVESSDYSSDTDSSSSKKRHKCTEKGCNASFSKNYKLILHIRKHTGDRPFVCDEIDCTKTYTNASHLRRHKKISHGEKELQTILCPYEGCGLVLANKYSLKKHYNRKHNTNNYEFICTECSQGFHRKKQLQQHSYLHTGEAPFKCDDCGINFTTNYGLNRHKRSHRTYTCDCGESFNKWSLILTHKKNCNQPRFKCEVCDKSFSHLGNFNNHKLVHKDKSEKLVYVCPYPDCKRYYFYKKNVKYHIDNYHKKVNETKSYKCTYSKCKTILKTKQSLKMHLQRHFQWVKKKQRKTRSDKGKPKKLMMSVLIGGSEIQKETAEHSSEDKLEDENRNENSQLQITEKKTDDVLLKHCDLTLSLPNEKMIAAS